MEVQRIICEVVHAADSDGTALTVGRNFPISDVANGREL